MVLVAPGRFLQRMGDIVFDYHCPNITVSIREDIRCYREIPVDHPTHKFVDPITKVLLTQGTPRPCLPHFPVAVEGIGAWYTLSPHIKVMSPANVPVANYVPSFQIVHDFDQNIGVLTESEIRDWTHMVAQGHLNHWTAETLTSGICQSQGDCPLQAYAGQPSFSLFALEEKVVHAITPDWIPALCKGCRIVGNVEGGLYI